MNAHSSYGISQPLGLGPDQAAIDSEVVTSNQSSIDSAPPGRLDQLAEQNTLAAAAAAVVQESRVDLARCPRGPGGRTSGQPEFTGPPRTPDTEAGPHEQHA
jgi:hypothetical protein